MKILISRIFPKQSISDAVGLERTYLYRIFKEITGVTIQEYLTDLKIKKSPLFSNEL